MEPNDIVKAALNKDADAFVSAFDTVVNSKISDALEVKKVEIASRMLSPIEVQDNSEVETEVEGNAEDAVESE
jgi:hypothetical protein